MARAVGNSSDIDVQGVEGNECILSSPRYIGLQQERWDVMFPGLLVSWSIEPAVQSYLKIFRQWDRAASTAGDEDADRDHRTAL